MHVRVSTYVCLHMCAHVRVSARACEGVYACVCVRVCVVSQLLSLSFTAYFEKDVNWNVVIRVERKATDLRVNVKAQGYAISCQLTCEDTAAGDKQLMSATAVNEINLGRVLVRHLSHS